MNEWGHFVEDVRSFYDVDLSCISEDFEKVCTVHGGEG